MLHLGEDRFLTSLIMKHYPSKRMSFTSDSKCKTKVPDSWKVFLSQRRRWINSTVHNLFELLLLDELCGFCLFSMRFVIFIDLFATLVQPASIVYVAYLIYLLSDENSQFPLISLVMIAAIYGLQLLIILLRREWQHVFWMIVYIVTIPFWSFILPIYAFWYSFFNLGTLMIFHGVIPDAWKMATT